MQVAHYEVLSEIARGGSAAVFRARHVQSGHHVALKLLLPEVANEARGLRLLREGQALARMNHPNLMRCEAHGRENGVTYLALTLVQGASLQDRLSREGPLSYSEALSIGIDVGHALSHAHAHGVLHRDLKPDNVLASEYGRIVLCDFGLLRQDLDSRDLTRSGQLLGTPGYWPPEQAMGQLRQIGPASDVYGWAALVYALLSGGPPRPSASLAEAMDKLSAPVPALRHSRQDVPAALERLLQRALAFDPADRPGLDEAISECERLRNPPAAPSRRFPVGAALGLACTLPALAAVWAFTRGAEDASPADSAAVARELPQGSGSAGAAQVSGSGPAAKRTRSAEVRALWKALKFDEALAVAQAWVDEAPDDRTARRVLATACQQGGDASRALRMLNALLEEDPDDVDALLGRAQLLTLMRRAEAAHVDLKRAIQLDPGSAPAQVLRGALLCLERRHVLAELSFVRALELDPNSSTAHYERGRNWHAQERQELAVEHYTAALKLQPGFLHALGNLALAYQELGRFAEAREVYMRAIKVNAEIPKVWFNLGNLNYAEGNFAAALEDFDRALALDPVYASAYVNRGLVHSALGDLPAAIADYDSSLRLRPGHTLSLFNRANAKQQLGDYAGAIADCTGALAANPPDYDVLATRGFCYANTGRLKLAEADYVEFLRRRPNHVSVPDVQGWLAEVREVLARPR